MWRRALEPVKKYDVERRTRRTRRKTLGISLYGFRGFCVVRDFFTRSKAIAVRGARLKRMEEITSTQRPLRPQRKNLSKRCFARFAIFAFNVILSQAPQPYLVFYRSDA